MATCFARNLSVDDLQSHIAVRFDLVVDMRTLARLARGERVRRLDMETAATTAAALDVRLDDIIFFDDVIPMGDKGKLGTHRPDDEEEVLAPEQSRRLSDLFDLRGRRSLTDDELAEVDALVGAWGRAVSERGFRELAQRRGVLVEQVRAAALAGVDRALAWWREVQANPVRLKTVMREARNRHRRPKGPMPPYAVRQIEAQGPWSAKSAAVVADYGRPAGRAHKHESRGRHRCGRGLSGCGCGGGRVYRRHQAHQGMMQDQKGEDGH